MLSWQVGKVKITRVVEMEVAVPYDPKHPFLIGATPEELQRVPWLYPSFVDEKHQLKLSFHALLVDAPGLRLVVDTCFGNDKPRHVLGGEPLATPFLRDFEAAGWSRETVQAVLCTHLHVDHVGWNTMLVDGRWTPTFPNARYIFGREEFSHWREHGDDEQRQILADSVEPIFEAGLAFLAPMDHVLSNEVRLTPSAGHTPGHVSVLIESEGQRAVITGDMAHHPCQFAHPEWYSSFDFDGQASTHTRNRMFSGWAREEILVIGTHFAGPTAGRVRNDGDVYRFDVR